MKGVEGRLARDGLAVLKWRQGEQKGGGEGDKGHEGRRGRDTEVERE